MGIEKEKPGEQREAEIHGTPNGKLQHPASNRCVSPTSDLGGKLLLSHANNLARETRFYCLPSAFPNGTWSFHTLLCLFCILLFLRGRKIFIFIQHKKK